MTRSVSTACSWLPLKSFWRKRTSLEIRGRFLHGRDRDTMSALEGLLHIKSCIRGLHWVCSQIQADSARCWPHCIPAEHSISRRLCKCVSAEGMPCFTAAAGTTTCLRQTVGMARKGTKWKCRLPQCICSQSLPTSQLLSTTLLSPVPEEATKDF